MKALVALIFLFLLATSLEAGSKESLPLRKQVEKTKVTGTIDGKSVRLKTRETKRYKLTTGYIDGKYVRLKEKKQ